MSKLLKPKYLGDGVYVHHEEGVLTLAVNHHENKVVVLEPEVLKQLFEYAKEAKLIEIK